MRRMMFLVLPVMFLVLALAGCGKKAVPEPSCCYDYCYHPPVIYPVNCCNGPWGHVAVQRIKPAPVE